LGVGWLLCGGGMGKRKKATKPPPKAKAPKLEKVFDCPFCDSERTVDAVVKDGVGSVRCRNCGAGHSKKVHALEEGIDVFHDWVDATVEANRAQEDGYDRRGDVRDDEDEDDEEY